MDKIFIRITDAKTNLKFVNLNQIVSVTQTIGKSTTTITMSNGEVIENTEQFSTFQSQFKDFVIERK